MFRMHFKFYHLPCLVYLVSPRWLLGIRTKWSFLFKDGLLDSCRNATQYSMSMSELLATAGNGQEIGKCY